MLQFLHERFNWGFTAMFPVVGISFLIWFAGLPPVVEVFLLGVQIVMVIMQIAVVVQQMRGKL